MKQSILLYGAAAALAALAAAVVAGHPWLGVILFAASAGLLLVGGPDGLAWSEIPSAGSPRRAWEPYFLLFLLLAGALPRLWSLDAFPPGAHGHEGEVASRTMGLGGGESYTPHIPEGDINWPTLVFYEGLGVTKVLGWSAGHLRVAPALWGILSLFMFYFLARRLASPGSAAVATLLFASCPLHLSMSRNFFPGSLLFVPPLLGMYFLIKGIRTPRWYYFAAAGFGAALSLHGFIPGRTLGALFLAWLGWLWFTRRDLVPGRWAQAIFWLAFFAVAAPVLVWALGHSDQYWGYIQSQNPNRGHGIFSYFQTFLGMIPDYAGMFQVHGDPGFSDNIPGTPLLDPVTGLFFATGFFLCLGALWKPLPSFLLPLLVLGLLPAMMGTGFAHPTARRVVMVLPAVYLMGALGLERFRAGFQALPGISRRTASWILGAAGAVISAWCLAHSLHWYFSVYSQDAGVRGSRDMPAYYAGKQVRLCPECRVVSMPWPVAQVTTAILFPANRPVSQARSMDELFILDSGSNVLLLLDPAFRAALPLLENAYPHAQTQTVAKTLGRDDQPDHHVDPFAPDLDCLAVRVPQEDILAFQGMVDLSNGRRVSVFKSAQAAGPARRELAGTLMVPGRGGKAVFEMAWKNWTLKLDGRNVPWGAMALDGGFHSIRLAGRVPDAGGVLPLRVTVGNQELVGSGRLVPLDLEQGLMADYFRGEGGEDSGKPELRRREILPLVRFYDITELPVPFTVVYSGSVRVPADGEYRFFVTEPGRARVSLGGVQAFNNLTATSVAAGLSLKAGRWLPLRVVFHTGNSGFPDRTFLLLYTGPGSSQPAPVPGEWLRPS